MPVLLELAKPFAGPQSPAVQEVNLVFCTSLLREMVR